MGDGVEQIRAEQRERWRKGERVPAEEYLARHGTLRDDQERTLELIYQEILLREEQGETPQAEEYQQRFPQLASRLQKLFEVHSVLASAALLAPAAGDEEVPPTIRGQASDRATLPYPLPPLSDLPVIPGYEVLEKLGQGGMAVVYKAKQKGLDRLVAVKVLLPGSSGDPAFAERFAREAQALARLSHPNVVAVHDFGQAGGLCYLVMEYVEGSDLRRAMTSRPLGQVEALRIVAQVCDALQFAHDQGVIHRDIKPDNVLLDRQGRVKVADFGLAKLLGPRPDAGLTGAQQVMGTWHYMAPEQVRGARDVDHRADLYSLGVTLYELLTGERPVGHFPPPSRRSGVDPRLDPVVLRALESDPALRYQSASEIKADLEALTQSSRRLGLSYLRWVVLPAVVLSLLLLVGTCFALGQNFAETQKPTLLWLGMNGFLVLGVAFLVASLVWLLRLRDATTIVPTCGVLSLVLVLWGLYSVSMDLLNVWALTSLAVQADASTRAVLLTVWALTSLVFRSLTTLGFFVGGVGLLLWRGWARRLVVATCWLGLVYESLEGIAYAVVLMPVNLQEFIRKTSPDERTQFLVGVAGVLLLALAVVLWLAGTVGQLVLLNRSGVVRAFSPDGDVPATHLEG